MRALEPSLAEHVRRARPRSLLRFLTCGSVDDGKSTLIGRLLYDSKLDLRGPARGARDATRARIGTTGDDIDFALLVDGLEAEREQGITIDVAYRFFATPRRRSSSPTRRATSSTRATWRPAPRTPTSPSSCRRAQGRADADPAARDHRLAARHPPRRARGQQDRPRRLRPGASSTHRRRLSRVRRSRSASPRSTPIPLSARFGDNVIDAQPTHALVRGPDAARAISKRVDVERDAAATAVPLAGAMGEPAAISISAALPARSPPAASAPATSRGRGVRPANARRAHRHRRRRPADARRGRRRGHADARPTRSTSRAATCCVGRRARPKSPTSSPRTSSG